MASKVSELSNEKQRQKERLQRLGDGQR